MPIAQMNETVIKTANEAAILCGPRHHRPVQQLDVKQVFHLGLHASEPTAWQSQGYLWMVTTCIFENAAHERSKMREFPWAL